MGTSEPSSPQAAAAASEGQPMVQIDAAPAAGQTPVTQPSDVQSRGASPTSTAPADGTSSKQAFHWTIAAMLLLSAIASVSVGVWMLVSDTRIPALPDFAFGLLALSIVLLLLAAPVLVAAFQQRRQSKQIAVEAEKAAKSAELQQQQKIWHAMPMCDVVSAVGGNEDDPSDGLAAVEAKRRLAVHGPNTIAVSLVPPFWSVFLQELHEPTQLLLLAVAAIYSLVGKISEALAAFAITFTVLAAEAATEYRARSALSSLSSDAPKFAKVRVMWQWVA